MTTTTIITIVTAILTVVAIKLISALVSAIKNRRLKKKLKKKAKKTTRKPRINKAKVTDGKKAKRSKTGSKTQKKQVIDLDPNNYIQNLAKEALDKSEEIKDKLK